MFKAVANTTAANRLFIKQNFLKKVVQKSKSKPRLQYSN